MFWMLVLIRISVRKKVENSTWFPRVFPILGELFISYKELLMAKSWSYNSIISSLDIITKIETTDKNSAEEMWIHPQKLKLWIFHCDQNEIMEIKKAAKDILNNSWNTLSYEGSDIVRYIVKVCDDILV